VEEVALSMWRSREFKFKHLVDLNHHIDIVFKVFSFSASKE
jgi:hypothetical protein